MKNLICDIKANFFLYFRNLSQKDFISFYYNAQIIIIYTLS